MKIEDFDLENAWAHRSLSGIELSDDCITDIIEAAIPPVTRWDGKEELRINHLVMFENDSCCVVHTDINDSNLRIYLLKNKFRRVYWSDLTKIKPIPPEPNKIDHSSLAHTGIDCTYHSDQGRYFAEYYHDDDEFKSIRMNTWMVWEGSLRELKAAIPEGYMLEHNLIYSSCYQFRVVAVKEGYTL